MIKRSWSQEPNERPLIDILLTSLRSAMPPETHPITEKAWHIDPSSKKTLGDKKYERLPASPKDFQKVLEFYSHHPMPGYEVASVEVIHNPSFNRGFELHMAKLQERHQNPAFKPNWSWESHPEWRKKINEAFETLAKPYTDPDYPNVKLLPLWHGTKPEILDSIFRVGFANLASTDAGFFGKGLYSAFEAEYAYRVYGQGALLLNWVAIYSAYPTIDGDMGKLAEKANYQNYDAHFVPVVPKTSNPHESTYLPAKPNQKHTYTEVVVFDSAACLPRYLVQLQPTLTKQLTSSSPPASKPTATFPKVDHPKTSAPTSSTSKPIVAAPQIAPSTATTPKKFWEYFGLAISSNVEPPKTVAPTSSTSKPIAAPKIGSPMPIGFKKLSDYAFGKAQWAKYFGDVDFEPDLPDNIEEILNGPCPFWPDKKVFETHILILIPQTVNGKPLTLNSLEKIIQEPKQGPATEYSYYWKAAKKEHGETAVPAAHWVLMTKDGLPDTRSKSYADQMDKLARYSKKSKVDYEVPHALEAAAAIFMHYRATGKRLYSDHRYAFTRCQETAKGRQFLVVGFPDAGLQVNYDYDYDEGHVSLAALRRFFPSVSPGPPKSIAVSTKIGSSMSISTEIQPSKTSAPTSAPKPIAVVPKTVSSMSAIPKKLSDIGFGKAKWEQYFGDVGVEPALPANIEEILNSPCPFWPSKTVLETHILVLIPQSVNGQPLTLNSLGELIQKPKKGPPARYRNYWKHINNEHGNKAVPSSYWVLMTRDVLPETRSKNYDNQNDKWASYMEKVQVDYEVPQLLEAVVVTCMHHCATDELLYSDSPVTYTACQERTKGFQLIVGSFTPAGILIQRNLGYDFVGLAAIRRLF